MKNIRKSNDQKGFTLVELIVVLVILAILAAMLVPALLGYIDEARQKQYALEARTIYEATTTYVTQEYGKNVTDRSALLAGGTIAEVVKASDNGAAALDKISSIADIKVTDITGITYSSNQSSISAMKITFVSASNGTPTIEGTLKDGSWTFVVK